MKKLSLNLDVEDTTIKKVSSETKVKPIVPSIVSAKEYRQLYNIFAGMQPIDPLYKSYKVALDKGVRKSNRTKRKSKNREEMIKTSRKNNWSTKGRTKNNS